MTILIRAAGKGDAVMAALLLAETAGEFGVQVLGLGKPELQIKALQTWFMDEGNRFSYQESTVAESYGIAAGLLLAFSGRRLNALELGCARKLLPIYGLRQAWQMLQRNHSLINQREAEADEYLIAHLAVDAQFRRQGIARRLLDQAQEDCCNTGLDKLVLEVEMVNERAIRVYRAAGFEIVDTLRYHLTRVKLECPGYYKMLKKV